MSRSTEESEKCDLQELGEHLNKIKECGEFIEKSYKNAKEQYDSIVKKDQGTDEYEISFRKILGHLKDVCEETVKRVKDLEENGLNKMYKIEQAKNESVKKLVVSEKDTHTPENTDDVDKEQINGEENADDNRNEDSRLLDQEKKKKEEMKKARKVDDSNKENPEDLVSVSKNGVEDSIPSASEPESANKATSSEQKKKAKEGSEVNENLDKENEKPEENSVEKPEVKEEVKDPPKGIIRVISIEKLLDPSIAALHKRSQRQSQYSNLLNSSVIVLDSDDDEPSVSIAPQKDTPLGNAKQKETLSKSENALQKDTSLSNAKQTETPSKSVNKEAAAPKVSKPTVEEIRKDESKKNQYNPKLKRVAVRVKSSKLLKEMLEKKCFKIKLSKLNKGLDSEPELNKERNTASARRSRKRNSVNRQRQREMSSDSDKDDSYRGRSKTNVKAN